MSNETKESNSIKPGIVDVGAVVGGNVGATIGRDVGDCVRDLDGDVATTLPTMIARTANHCNCHFFHGTRKKGTGKNV